MGDDTPRSETGAILVEYGMILIAILLVSFALIQLIGGRVLELFEGVLPGF
jgi:Flp pilus assembly pilin Flp